MNIRSVRESSLTKLQSDASSFIVACGYEHRSQGITSLLENMPEHRIALCFKEFPQAFARAENEQFFSSKGFMLRTVGANAPDDVRSIVSEAIQRDSRSSPVIAFDISTMTRAWHGAIVRQLRIHEHHNEIRTLFAYVPAQFQLPMKNLPPNEFVSPVDGFTSLGTPDLPVAAIIGLGYDREGAMGLQQLIDPQLTVLLIPHASNQSDPFHKRVVQNNDDVISRTKPEWIYDYDLREPASTFAMLASIVSGLTGSYRIILASLGPKIFGLLCFLLSSRYPDASVWRISSGIHGLPRDSYADLDRVVVLEVTWQPTAESMGD